MNAELMQIGEFARQADTNLRTLRYYEEMGLIKPARRSAGKFRYYNPEQVKRVAAIKRLQSLGLSLKEIQEVMAPAACDSVAETMTVTLDKQLELLGDRLQALQTEFQELRSARAKLDQCRQCQYTFGNEACIPCTAGDPAAYAVLRSMN